LPIPGLHGPISKQGREFLKERTKETLNQKSRRLPELREGECQIDRAHIPNAQHNKRKKH
jgi:hypothetical protein